MLTAEKTKIKKRPRMVKLKKAKKKPGMAGIKKCMHENERP